MSEVVSSEVVSSELELDGKIYLVNKDAEGNEVSRDLLDGQKMLEVVAAVLDDAIRNPLIDKLITPIE